MPLLSSWERKQAEPLNLNLLFAGQYTDDENGLAYNHFRYYDPQSGNYLASDPIGLNGGETPYSYVNNPLEWVDPFGLNSKKCGLIKESENINWSPHGYKHVPPKNKSWNDIIKSTKSGPAKYKPGENIEQLERSVWETGQSVTNGKTWKVKDLGREIEASEGKSNQWMRVEMSANTIHGHPISKAEFMRLIK